MGHFRRLIVYVLLTLLPNWYVSAQPVPPDPAQLRSDSLADMAPPRFIWEPHPVFSFSGPVVQRLETPFAPPDRSTLFYFCLGMVFFLAIVRSGFEKYFRDLFMVFYRSNFRQNSLKEQLSQNRLPSLLLNLLFFISAGMFVNLLAHGSVPSTGGFWRSFLLWTAAIGGVYAVKWLMLQVSGWLFHVREAAAAYTFVVFLVNKLMGIVLIPATVLLAIGYTPAADMAIVVAGGAIAILLLYRYVQGFQLVKSKSRTSPLHFFVYFCAFELLPLLLLGKIAWTALQQNIQTGV